MYELTEAWHAAPLLNSEKILNRSCRSAAAWERPQGDAPEPFFRNWTKNYDEIHDAFSKAEREGMEFVRFKVPPETPVSIQGFRVQGLGNRESGGLGFRV